MKKLSFLYIPLVLLASACTKNLTDLNSNGKATTTAPATTVFLGGEKNLVDYYTTPSVSSAPFRVIAQSWTENTYTSEARYNFTQYNAPDGWWANLYSYVLNNLYKAKTLFANDVKDQAELRNDLIITDILEVYTYNLLVTTYGNIPYTEAENAAIPFPKYDDAKTVYYDLLNRLDTCIAGLNTSAGAMGNADQIYKGDVSKWKKFAATLKLKMAMLLADVDAATAAKKVQEAIAAGIFTSNDDNAAMAYDASSTNTSNPIWQALVNSGRHDFSPAAFMVNTMVKWNDPRLPLYYNTRNGQYIGGVAGASNSYTTLSTFSDQWLDATYPGDILDYSETEFLLAEAAERGFGVNGSAESHYNNAVTASIQFWGGTTTAAAAYLAQPAVAYATATGDYKQKIGYQKWIAMANRNWDAWTEIRRLKQPDIDNVNPPVTSVSALPLRFYYPTAEQTSNSVNWKAAVSAQTGGSTNDVVSTKLFWMP